MPKDEGITRSLKDITAGSIGGIAQVLTGQPFDIVKVRLQTQGKEYAGAIDCARKIVRNEGILAFYKGTATPLFGVGAYVSTQFGVFHFLKRFFGNINERRGRTQLTSGQLFMSGFGAGVAASFVACPMELVRIRLQTQKHGEYKGPIDCIRKIYRDGGFTSFYRGIGPTIGRVANGMGLYFLCFETLMRRETSKGTRREDIPNWLICLYGAISGEALWVGVYPFDVVKSRLQVVSSDGGRMYKGTWDCVVKSYREGGIGTFYRGILPAMCRAAPVNAATFIAVETALRYLG